MPYRQLLVELAGDELGQVEQLLEACGAIAITLSDAGDTPVLEPAPGETPLWPKININALFADDVDIADVARQLRAACPAVGGIDTATLAERNWLHAWHDDATPQRFGDRLWICPHGESSGVAGAIEVELDPGLAFGTGSHPTTAMCLEWLTERALEGCTVIDYGCGSGILSVAALKLGADRVAATDIDPQALMATRANAAANGVAADLTVTLAEDFWPELSDVLVANILAGTLIELASRLTALVIPGGRIALSGILIDQAREVMLHYADAVDFAPPEYRGDWALVSGLRRSPSR